MGATERAHARAGPIVERLTKRPGWDRTNGHVVPSRCSDEHDRRCTGGGHHGHPPCSVSVAETPSGWLPKADRRRRAATSAATEGVLPRGGAHVLIRRTRLSRRARTPPTHAIHPRFRLFSVATPHTDECARRVPSADRVPLSRELRLAGADVGNRRWLCARGGRRTCAPRELPTRESSPVPGGCGWRMPFEKRPR